MMYIYAFFGEEGNFIIKYEREKCVYQECVALMMCSKTSTYIPMIMSIITHKTLRNCEKKIQREMVLLVPQRA